MSKAHEGNPMGKWVRLYNDDHELAREKVPILECLERGGGDQRSRAARACRPPASTCRGVLAEYERSRRPTWSRGRFINPDDQGERRKVAVTGAKVRENLFRPDAT